MVVLEEGKKERKKKKRMICGVDGRRTSRNILLAMYDVTCGVVVDELCLWL